MNLEELKNKIETTQNNVDTINAKLAEIKPGDYKERQRIENLKKSQLKELRRWKNLLNSATNYSSSIMDENTAVILYTTKQANLFLGMSRSVCRRIRKGYYAKYQDWISKLLNGSESEKLRALEILHFKFNQLENVSVKDIKFDMIQKELDNHTWSF